MQQSREIEIEDPSLSKEGFKQAEELGSYFKTTQIAHIYCSPFLRCLQTATPISEKLGLPIKIEYGLRETFWEFTKNPKIITFEQSVKEFNIEKSYISHLNPIFPETIAETHERSANIIRILNEKTEGDFVCVTHEYIVCGIVRGLLSKTSDEMDLGCPNAGIFKLSKNRNVEGWEIEIYASVNHLTEPRKAFLGLEGNELNLWLDYYNLKSLDDL